MANEKNGTALMFSYGMGKFLAEFLTGAFASLVFKFYETEIGLPTGLVAAAVVLYSIWNAINDPLIGFFTAKPTFLAPRWGRRFPWILIGSLTCVFAFVLVFTPLRSSTVTTFLWLLLSICLYDALYSTWEVNYQSIFPDRFREGAQRTKAAGIATLVGVLGVAGGAVLPTFFVRYGHPETYFLNALVCAGLGLVAAILLLPGVRETPDMVRRYLDQESKREVKASLKAQVAEVFSSKNFLAFIVLYFFYQSATISMTASIHYVGDYLLGGKSTTLIFAGMLAGALAGVPLWSGLRRFIKSNQRLLALSAAALALFCVPLMFVSSYYCFVAAMFAWGLAFGGFWMLMTPAMADVIDEVVVNTGKRDDGVYIGFRAFAGRLAYAIQALSFWIVHALSGFAADPRSDAAKMGIRIHTALIPAVLLVLGVVFFLCMNGMDAEKAARNREIMKERGL
ncbi:MAG: MFS transporter [Spirochaetes bacterium]|nr:MFS transporter [Spirochaetota bacterium]